MTHEELIKVVQQIRIDKKPVTMSVRELINALGYEKRTSGNVWHINNFLDKYQLITVPYFEDVWIDDGINLCFKHVIKHDGFQLYSLHLEEYKNFKNLSVNFENTENYAAFIGLNGSGKSNVLEAVSSIFYSLYHIATLKDGFRSYACPFKYTISYILNGEYYEISNGKQYNGDKVTLNILPKNIIASYSGEDTRLWDRCYRLIYDKYCSKLTAEVQGFAPPYMFYISKYQWEIATLVLLYSEDVDVKAFIRNLIGNKVCSITFEYVTKNFPKWEGTNIYAFIEKIKEDNNYSIDAFRDVVNEISFIDQSSTLFYYLYRSTIGTENKLISKINIKFDDGSDLDSFSEGEKKLILTNTIIHILSTQDSLCLFDEPDSHIHISRKNELIKLIDNPKRYSLVTTHSSILAHKMRFNNLIFLNNGKLENADKISKINKLTGGEINYIEGAFVATSKNIVIVEGTYDIKYIKKAIQIFGLRDSKYYKLDELSFVPQESAGNTSNFFEDIVKGMHENADMILYIFDFDKAGQEGADIVRKLKGTYPKLDYIFYQENYNSEYEKGIEDIFFVEDLFAEESYKSIVADIHSKKRFREFKSNNQGSTHDRIKKYIEKGYLSSFSDDFFNGFAPLLDELINRFNLS